MKISQEVRDFAKANPAPAQELAADEAEAGMAAMSERFHEKGGELYVPAAE
jgi:phosphomethylpyrimidine synthase